MDETLNATLRRAGREPTAAGPSLAAVRRLRRAGRPDEAREHLRARLAARRFDGETLGALAGPLPPIGGAAVPVGVDLRRPGRGRACPVVAVSGPPGAGAFQVVLALAQALAADRTRLGALAGEPAAEALVLLPEPWTARGGYAVDRLRLLALPWSEAGAKVRRRLLHHVSALGLCLASGPDDEAGAERLARDVRRVHNCALTDVPLAVLGCGLEPVVPAAAAGAPARRVALETTAAPAPPGQPPLARFRPYADRVVAERGALEVLAALLLAVEAGMERLVRPRRR